MEFSTLYNEIKGLFTISYLKDCIMLGMRGVRWGQENKVWDLTFSI